MKQTPLLITILLFLSVLLQAQSGSTRKGDAYMQRGLFEKAIDCYKQALLTDSNDVVSKEKLALAYRISGQYSSAEFQYKQLVNMPASGPQNKLNLAQVFCITGKYDSAALMYSAYADAQPE